MASLQQQQHLVATISQQTKQLSEITKALAPIANDGNLATVAKKVAAYEKNREDRKKGRDEVHRALPKWNKWWNAKNANEPTDGDAPPELPLKHLSVKELRECYRVRYGKHRMSENMKYLRRNISRPVGYVPPKHLVDKEGTIEADLEEFIARGADLADFTLIAANGDCVKAHALILSARSTVIEMTVRSGVREYTVEAASDKQSLNALVRGLYTNRVPVVETIRLLELMTIFEYLEVPNLNARCARAVVEGLNPETAGRAMVAAIAIDNERLKKDVLSYLCKTPAALKTEAWHEAVAECPVLKDIVLALNAKKRKRGAHVDEASEDEGEKSDDGAAGSGSGEEDGE